MGNYETGSGTDKTGGLIGKMGKFTKMINYFLRWIFIIFHL